MTVAAFTAVASTSHTYEGERVSPEALRLPPAVLVHDGHGLPSVAAGPVAVALPAYVAGTVTIHAVFATRATAAAERVRRGLRTVSICATGCYFTKGRRELRNGVLASVDLVPLAGDPGARITAVTHEADLSDDLGRSRAAFDAYLASGGPQLLDLLPRIEGDGVRAFAPLEPVVAGIRADLEARARTRAEQMAEVQGMLRRLHRRVPA